MSEPNVQVSGLLAGDFEFLLLLVAQADVELAQLLFVDRSRSVRQQALGALRLREGDDVTDGVRFAHHRDDAVETEGEAAVRRSTELEGVEQEAELLTGFFRTDLEGFEDLFLDFFAVDTDGAAADFPEPLRTMS